MDVGGEIILDVKLVIHIKLWLYELMITICISPSVSFSAQNNIPKMKNILLGQKRVFSLHWLLGCSHTRWLWPEGRAGWLAVYVYKWITQCATKILHRIVITEIIVCNFPLPNIQIWRKPSHHGIIISAEICRGEWAKYDSNWHQWQMLHIRFAPVAAK